MSGEPGYPVFVGADGAQPEALPVVAQGAELDVRAVAHSLATGTLTPARRREDRRAGRCLPEITGRSRMVRDAVSEYGGMSRQFRSGAGALGSTPGVVFAAGAFAVLVMVRLASLRFQLKEVSEADSGKTGKEAPMKTVRAVTGASLETAWSLAVSAAGGQLLS